MQKHRQLPLPKTVAFDVDGTLISGSTVNGRIVSLLREYKSSGFEVVVWSMRGTDYAKRAVDLAGVGAEVDCVISKPGVIVDDKGWTWVRDTKVISSARVC